MLSRGTIDRATREPELQFDRSEAKYRGLLEAAPDAIMVASESGGIVLLNVQTQSQQMPTKRPSFHEPALRSEGS